MRIERFLVVGFGSIGARHARLLRQMRPDAAIGVLRRAAAERPDGVDECFASVNDALAFRPQAAVIANPAALHLAVALKLADAGVHVLVEKPLSISADGIDQLIHLCRERRVVLAVGYNLRSSPSLQQFRRMVQGGQVGRVLSVRAQVGQFLPTWRPALDYRQSVSAQAALGGGVLLELSHEIDYLRWIFGDVDWVSAVSLRQSRLEIDVEDTAHVTLGFARRSAHAPVVAQLNMDFVRQDAVRECIAIGETGTLCWNAQAGTVERWDSAPAARTTLFSHSPQRDDDYLAEWQAFLSAAEDGGAVSVTGDDALQVMRIVDAARRSSRERRVIDLDPPVAP